MNILGISAFYHDSAACIVQDGKVIAAAQEERFTRIKQDESYPVNAVEYCLKEAKLSLSDIDAVAYYDKPGRTFKRLFTTYLHTAPKSFYLWKQSLPLWLKTKLHIKSILRKKTGCKNILFTDHHKSHSASAFYPSPFEEAAILTIDGVGEYATTTVSQAKGSKIEQIFQLNFPDSLGLLYSAFTDFLGFRINSGEYKMMGLAPYGEPKYKDIILTELVDVKEDGSIRLNKEYFDYVYGTGMTNKKIQNLLGAKRQPEGEIVQRHMDIAASIQEVTEDIIIKMARFTKANTGKNYLCLAGGVALNCVANGKLLTEKIFDDIWIQPAAGDAGGSIGSALSVYYEYYDNKRTVSVEPFSTYLGPNFDYLDVVKVLNKHQLKFDILDGDSISTLIAKLLADGLIVGHFNGRMEFGPRALGNRSILGDPRNPATQETMNLKIKYRESFRPFAPSVLAERTKDFFDINTESPYMLLVAPVNEDRCHQVDYSGLELIEKVKQPRSDIPAVTHLNYSARLHTVTEQSNKRYYDIIKKFGDLTGYPLVVNTSFNIRGEPIVCTPEDAVNCFFGTEIDILILGDIVIYKSNQPNINRDYNYKDKFKLD